MKKALYLFFASALMLAGFSVGRSARAATPVLTLSAGSDGDSVTVTVNGDANSSVLFYYTKTNVGSQISSIGTTNSSGYLSTTISTTSYGIAANSTVYVKTGGISGAQSNTLTWPASATSGNFYLSPTGVSLTVGQSASVTAYNVGSGYVYVSNNSNPSIANVNTSGNQISINANAYGSTVANICLQNSSSTSGTTCASV